MKIGVQTGGTVKRNDPEPGYRLIAEAGFEAIDFGIDPELSYSDIKAGKLPNDSVYFKSVDAIEETFANEVRLAKKYGLAITQAHAPFPAYAFAHPETLDHMIGVYKKTIEYCDRIGCKNLVVHGISLPGGTASSSPEAVRELNRKLYTSLIPTLKTTDVTVCLENLFSHYYDPSGMPSRVIAGVCANPHEAARDIDEYNAEAGKECFGLCFDTGHLQILRGDMRSYLAVIGKRLKALHIHDNDAIEDLHLAPYTGTIVWDDFTSALRDVGYDGDLCFETFRQVYHTDPALVPDWLRLIRRTGEVFRDRILK